MLAVISTSECERFYFLLTRSLMTSRSRRPTDSSHVMGERSVGGGGGGGAMAGRVQGWAGGGGGVAQRRLKSKYTFLPHNLSRIYNLPSRSFVNDRWLP